MQPSRKADFVDVIASAPPCTDEFLPNSVQQSIDSPVAYLASNAVMFLFAAINTKEVGDFFKGISPFRYSRYAYTVTRENRFSLCLLSNG